MNTMQINLSVAVVLRRHLHAGLVYTISMDYYEVLVGDSQFHGDSALTYAWDGELVVGTVVRIALRSRSVLGVIIRKVPKPSFATKPIAAVADTPAIPYETLQLIEWLRGYYPAPLGVIVRQFLPPTTAFSRAAASEISISTGHQTPENTSEQLPPLTSEQSDVVERISSAGFYLLHGITGSGKTRVYLELAQKTLESGRSVIILTPEIGLTEHLVRAFTSLRHPLHVLHSRLTVAARRDAWYKILASSNPTVVIGPRSALFTPLHNVGLIIMDESHDQAYKSDSAPRYRTDRVAARLARLHNAVFISGSATPNIEDLYVAEAKSRPILALKTLATQSEHGKPKTSIVDMRDKNVYGRSSIISQQLLAEISQALDRNEQILLFLNRRGTASAVLCSSCGWRALCEHCDLPLTYHGDSHTLRCHVCGRQQPLHTNCPECGHADIVLKTIGTKALFDEAQRLFPTARLRRFDTDTAKPDQIENQLNALQNGEVDIIIGTQMITKGLDLPRLAVVGVLNADSGLLVPDFTATERTYQLISQVVGRVGRGHRAGHVVLQTYSPDYSVLHDALTQNWDSFYTHELAERRAYLFPPFCYLLKLSCSRATTASAEKTAGLLYSNLRGKYPNLHIEGPSPAFHPREDGKYKWQLIVKSPSRSVLLCMIAGLPSGWTYDIDPIDLL